MTVAMPASSAAVMGRKEKAGVAVTRNVLKAADSKLRLVGGRDSSLAATCKYPFYLLAGDFVMA